MKAKRADRWERMVIAALKRNSSSSAVDFTNGLDVVDLLRKQHQWMVRMVKELQAKEAIEGPSVIGYRVALRQVLDRLTKRAS